jgi:hypothetical protein
MAAQLPDKIKMDGEWKELFTNPLEQYWMLRGKRPNFCSSQECARGYIATWEIADKELFLTNLQGEIKKLFPLFGAKTKKADLQEFFSNIFQKITKVKAEWYSGKLRVPLGKMTCFEDHGYDSRFERDMIITVVKGDITRIVTLDNSDHVVTEI